jgi:hypothetical protein
MASRARGCLIAVALLLGAISAYSMPASDCFDDENLKNTQREKPQGTLIYVWSPRMVYSAQQITVAERAAQSLGLGFTAVHDARVSPEDISAAIHTVNHAAGSLPLCAQKLLGSEALRHFPTAFVVTAQGVHRHPIVGAMPASAWHSSIAERLQQP